MTVEKLKRKLTTIFCADVQSYSTLMANDEADTLQRLRRYRAIMGELFERHDGRKVNTWGDAVIAEFSSVVEAVRCGVEIQDAIGAENRDLPAGQADVVPHRHQSRRRHAGRHRPLRRRRQCRGQGWSCLPIRAASWCPRPSTISPTGS